MPCSAPSAGTLKANSARATWSRISPNTMPAHFRAPGTDLAAKKETISRISPSNGMTLNPMKPWIPWNALPS